MIEDGDPIPAAASLETDELRRQARDAIDNYTSLDEDLVFARLRARYRRPIAE